MIALRVDLSGARAFLDYLEGRISGAGLLEHPAYRTVRRHARIFQQMEICAGDLERGLQGKESPLYGLEGVRENLPEILRVMETVDASGQKWGERASGFLQGLLPRERPGEITAYPIIGYDVGIGLLGAVVMNLGASLYLQDPGEMLFILAHEASHVLYNAFHGLPCLEELESPPDWWWLFVRMLQDEGFATFSALKLRRAARYRSRAGGPLTEDYRILADPRAAREATRSLAEDLTEVRRGLSSREEYQARIFSPQRLTYRAGAYLFQLIEASEGPEGVEKAFYRAPEEFWWVSGHLLLEGSSDPERGAP